MFKKVKENIDFKNEVLKYLKDIKEVTNNIDDIVVINERSLTRVNYWKDKFTEEHSKFSLYEIKAEKRILELEAEIKDLQKKLKKAEKGQPND